MTQEFGAPVAVAKATPNFSVGCPRRAEEIRGQERWFILRRPVGYGGQVAYGWMDEDGDEECVSN